MKTNGWRETNRKRQTDVDRQRQDETDRCAAVVLFTLNCVTFKSSPKTAPCGSHYCWPCVCVCVSVCMFVCRCVRVCLRVRVVYSYCVGPFQVVAKTFIYYWMGEVKWFIWEDSQLMGSSFSSRTVGWLLFLFCFVFVFIECWKSDLHWLNAVLNLTDLLAVWGHYTEVKASLLLVSYF